MQHYREKNYLDAATAFENIVNKYPNRFSGKRALSFLYKSQKHQKNEAAIRPLLDQIIATYPGKAVADLAQHLTVSELLKQAEFTEAAYKCQALLEKENEFTKYALFKLGNIYWYHLKDKARGEKYYRELIAAYPDHDLSISALANLGEWNPKAPKQPEPSPKDICASGNVKKFALLQNYPNPFNPTTTIPYQIAEDGPVSIKIFNILGEEVATLLNGDAVAGSHAVQWNGLNRYGQLVANGVYWVQLQSGQLIARRKVVMLQ